MPNIDKRDLMKFQSFYTAKEDHQRDSLQKRRKSFNLDIWSGVISRIYKEMTTLNNKKSNNAINKWAKMNRHFLKVKQNQIHDFQLKLISKKCKSKLHYDSSSLLSDWESRKILSSHLECLEMIIKCSKQATVTVTWPFTRGGTGQLINPPF